MDDATLLRFLENELTGEEQKRFLTHVRSCAACKTRLEEQRELSRLLHQFRPLYEAPESLRLQVSAAIEQHQRSLRVRLSDFLAGVFRPSTPAWKFATIGALLIIFCLIFYPDVAQRVRASNYIESAVTAHRNYVDGQFVPEIRTNSAQEILSWVSARVSFPFRLPVSQDSSSTRFQLAGARIIGFKGSNAVLVMYENRSDAREKASVLIAPENSAVVAGGDIVHTDHLTFHSRNSSGFKVITWNLHGLSYALVSSIPGSAQQSCLVCHRNINGTHATSPSESE